MKTTIGGDRLGSGAKQEVSIKNYSRSTHDLSYIWRSTMSAGTLVPFMSELALPGDTWDINLNCDVKTLPTVGPLFGSYKVQLDVFECPIRLYQGKLHMNMINIGMDMASIKLPQYELVGVYQPNDLDDDNVDEDNMYVNPSSIYAYLNVRGLGRTTDGLLGDVKRQFNAVPLLSYWEIYKNYYSNKQQSNRHGKAQGAVIHQSDYSNEWEQNTIQFNWGTGTQGVTVGGAAQTITFNSNTTGFVILDWPNTGEEYGGINHSAIWMEVDGVVRSLTQLFNTVNTTQASSAGGVVEFSGYTGILGGNTTADVEIPNTPFFTFVPNIVNPGEGFPQITYFDLENIDKMREEILQAVASPNAVVIDYQTDAPYGLGLDTVEGAGTDYKKAYAKAGQEGLGIKTYQSDLFNNWIDTEWIDGENGVGEVSAVLVQQNQATPAQDVIYMDSLNLQQKVYNMLNRIAVSGGTYDDWLDAVYTHERAKSIESPVYHGSLIKELSFEEVVSNADTDLIVNGQTQNAPLGTLAGRGRLASKHKGGQIKIKTAEPSYIMGIVSITPKIDYSQGNKWDVNLKTMNDFYKPELGAIGYQDLITGQMHWAGDTCNALGEVEHESAGKQPAWINYMTNVNQCRGNFAIRNNSMFMTLNRRYEQSADGIDDITTYIDPSKFNHIFAQTELDSQNFWVQIGNNITARRKMSAKVIPNL